MFLTTIRCEGEGVPFVVEGCCSESAGNGATVSNGIRISVRCYATMTYRRSRSPRSRVPVERWAVNMGLLDDSQAASHRIVVRNMAQVLVLTRDAPYPNAIGYSLFISLNRSRCSASLARCSSRMAWIRASCHMSRPVRLHIAITSYGLPRRPRAISVVRRAAASACGPVGRRPKRRMSERVRC